jgi:hypothetical protein
MVGAVILSLGSRRAKQNKEGSADNAGLCLLKDAAHNERDHPPGFFRPTPVRDGAAQ